MKSVTLIVVLCLLSVAFASKHETEAAHPRNVPSAKHSKLTCSGVTPIRQSSTFTCTISVKDLDNNDLEAKDGDFAVTVKKGAVAWVQKTGKTLSFSVTVDASTSIVQVFASVARNAKTQNIKNSPKSYVVYGTPSEKSTLACDLSKAAPGSTVTCTITLKDSSSKATTGLGIDFNVKSSNGENINISPVTKTRSSYTFEYTLSSTQYTTLSLHATVRSTGKALVGSPATVSTTGSRCDGYTNDKQNNIGSYINTVWPSTIGFSGTDSSLIEGMGLNWVALIYKGKMLIPSGVSKVYFKWSADDRARMIFNGELVSNFDSSFTSSAIAVTGGKAYSYEIGYLEYNGDQDFHFYWSIDGGKNYVAVPAANLILSETPSEFPANLKSGLKVDVFDPNVYKFSTFLGSSTTTTLDYSWSNTDKIFGFQADATLAIVGWLKIPAGVSSVKFYTKSDDGIRLFFDGNMAVDFWTDHGPTEKYSTSSYTVTAGQLYPIRVDYYDSGYSGTLQVKWSIDGGKTYTSIPSSSMFYGQIPTTSVSNTVSGIFVEAYTSDCKGTFGGILGTTTVSTINYDWGTGSILGYGLNNVGLIFKGYVTIPAGETSVRFRLNSDDGSRLIFDNKEIISTWVTKGSSNVESSSYPIVGGATYPFRVEYFECDSSASLSLSWAFDNENSYSIIPASAFTRSSYTVNKVNNAILVDVFTLDTSKDKIGTFVTEKEVSSLSWDWGTGSVLGQSSDAVSAVFFGYLTIPSGVTKINFKLASDDGSRLWFGGSYLISDYWYDHGDTSPKTASMAVTAGNSYAFRVDFYEVSGGADLKLLWCFNTCTTYSAIDKSYMSYASSTSVSSNLLGFRHHAQPIKKRSIINH